MNEVFKTTTNDSITFSDAGITLDYTWEDKVIRRYYPYGSIMKVSASGLVGTIFSITGKDTAPNGKNFLNTFQLMLSMQDKNRIKKAVAFATNKMRVAPLEHMNETVSKIEEDPEVEELIAELMDDTSSSNGEHRMRCNVCGKVFCYTIADIQQNMAHAKEAQMHATLSFLGTRLDAYAQQSQSRSALDKIVDYTHCPSCHSTNITEISAKEWEAMQQTVGTAPSPVSSSACSAADELKKFKELLDLGIITQEEFDAKKKQLLGM